MNFANPVTPAPIAAPLAARPPRRHVADRQRKGTGMTVVIHGIRNCDTMKKARTWLDSHGVAHRFHDYRADGIDPAMLEAWVRALGWEALLNRAGTTFRKLPEQDRQDLTEAKAIRLMLAAPGMIRRPVLAAGNTLLVGFDPKRYAATLGVPG